MSRLDRMREQSHFSANTSIYFKSLTGKIPTRDMKFTIKIVNSRSRNNEHDRMQNALLTTDLGRGLGVARVIVPSEQEQEHDQHR